MSCFVNDLVEWGETAKYGGIKGWKGFSQDIQYYEDGALKADQSYSLFLPIGLYRTSSNFPSNMWNSSHLSYCNCDTVMAKTTVIPPHVCSSTIDFLTRLKNTQGNCCFCCFWLTAVCLERLIKNSLFQAKGNKGKKYTVNIFINTDCRVETIDFYTLVFPFRTGG